MGKLRSRIIAGRQLAEDCEILHNACGGWCPLNLYNCDSIRYKHIILSLEN